MTAPLSRYQSYLVRIWQDGPHAIWHATLQHIQTNETRHFVDMDALYAYFQRETERDEAGGQPDADHKQTTRSKGAE